MEVEVVIEIPKGTRNKYEADEEGTIWLDRMLFTATRYPEDYGYVPGTMADDGDPVDAMVILDEGTFPGCHIHARPVGVFRMRDEKGVDAKVLCVLARDRRWTHVQDLGDLPEHSLKEIAHFFDIYKDLEPGKVTDPAGWEGRQAAEEEILRGQERFLARTAAPGPAGPASTPPS